MEIDKGFSLPNDISYYSDHELCIAFATYKAKYGTGKIDLFRNLENKNLVEICANYSTDAALSEFRRRTKNALTAVEDD